MTAQRVLVVNVGSSSVKLRVLDAADSDAVVWSRDLPAGDPAVAVTEALRDGPTPDAIGHRLVHGGPDLHAAAVVDQAVLAKIRAASELAPVHNPPALAALEASMQAESTIPNVACFDTTFHAQLPAAAALYALPRELIDRHRLRRYGFHGLSYAYATRRAAEMLGRPVADLRLVACHLGAGASAAAIAGGRSVDTTMGFTPLEGLVMARRSGSVDPGLVLWLERQAGLAPDELQDILEHRSGVAGLTGGTGDMRAVVCAAAGGDQRAQTALGVYVHRLRAAIASMAASLGGLDALVFTGGVGEGSDRVRTLACEGIEFMGIGVASIGKEEPPAEDVDLTADGAPVRTLVIHAREDVEVARETRAAIS